MSPTITIAIPMYNSVATVEETLASIRAQTFTDWRCVIANDGSTDASPEIVERWSREDDRVEMVSQHNQGLPEARNLGLERALALGSEFVMLLDSDDVLVPRALEWLLPAARELGASFGGFEFIDSAGRSIGRQSPMSAPEVGLEEQLQWYRTMLQVSLFSREAIGDIRFDPEVRLAEDWFWCTRMAMRGVRWRGVERIVAGYRLRPAGMSKNFAKMNAYHQIAIGKLFAMARRAGWAERIDIGQARHEQTAGTSAMGYASMQALVDPADPDKAAAIYESSVHPARLTALQMAQTVSNALPFGLCIGPDLDGVRERAFLPAVRRWWELAAARGWIEAEEVEAALVELSRKVIHPEQIVGEMFACRCLGPGRGATIGVIGLERNGRRLVRSAAAAGWRVIAFDDWSAGLEVRMLEPMEGVRVVRDRRELRDAGADASGPEAWFTGLMGPEAARAIARTERAAGRLLSVERWESHRERIGVGNLELMREALRAETAMAK